MSDLESFTEGGQWAITLVPGRTFSRTFWMREPDEVTGIALDGWDGVSQVRDEDGRLLLSFAIEVSQEADPMEPTCGQVDVTASASATADAADGRNVSWDLVLRRGSGPTLETRDLVARSDVVIEPGVTRA